MRKIPFTGESVGDSLPWPWMAMVPGIVDLVGDVMVDLVSDNGPTWRFRPAL